MSGYKVVQLGTVTPRKFDQLLDVNMTGVADGNLVAYAASTKTFVPYIGSGDVPPKLNLLEINVSGISTFNGVTISNGIITSSNPGFSSVVYYGDGSKLTGIVGLSSYVPTAGFSTFSNTTYNIFGGQSGNLVYQSSAGVTTFVPNGTPGQVLTFNGTIPQWQNISVSSGSVSVYDEGNLFGVVSGLNFVGSAVTVSGIGSTAVITISSGITSYVPVSGYSTSSGFATVSGYSTSSGISSITSNVFGGQSGNLVYQSSAGVTTFVPNGTPGQVLTFTADRPVWQNFTGGSGIIVYDEGSPVGAGGSVTTLNFVGSNINASVSPPTNGIATITFNDNIVASSLNVIGISTFNNNTSVGGSISLTASTGIISAVEFYGSGKSLTGILTESKGLRIFDEGNIVGSGYSFTNLNFVGDLVSVSGVGTTAIISINLGNVNYSNVSGYSTVSGISTVSGYSNISGYSTFSAVAGIATTSTRLQNIRTFEITGDIIASPQNFDGTQNVSFAATIKQDSVGLGTHTYGDYVKNITGTTGEIEVSQTSGEGASPQIGLPDNVSVANNLNIGRDVQINRNLNVNGNITIGGTSAYIIVDDFAIKDRDIVVGFTTNISGFDNSNDTTANTGGLAVASTEGSPLVNLVIAGIETLPATYKKIMWFQQNSFVGLNTDAWLFNYAVGVGSTQMPNGVWLASGNVQITKDDIIKINNINSSGIITANNFVGNLSGYSSSSGVATFANISGVSTNVSGGTGNLTSLNVTGVITGGTINSLVGTITTLGVSASFSLPLNAPSNPASRNLYVVSNNLAYRDSGNNERIILNNQDNLSNLSNITLARSNIGAAATGPVGNSGITFTNTQRVFARNSVGVGSGEEVTLSQLLDWGSSTTNTVLVRGASTWGALGFAGGLSIQSGNVVPIDYIKFVITNKGETASPETNRVETTVSRACIVIGATWELAPSAPGSSSSQAMLYARRSGTKTSLLSSNATLASAAILTDVTSTLTGTLTLAVGDTLGIDLISVGTGSSGHIFTVTVRYTT